MAFDLKKRFDHSDINSFLPDSKTVGTFDFYRTKFQNKFPDYYYELFEVLSRPEYNEEDCKELVTRIREEEQRRNNQIIDEYNERLNESIIES